MVIDDFKVPIIKKGISSISSLKNEFINKKIILFGVPGAFTPTCSEKHLPGYIKLYNSFIDKKIDGIYCLSVNDEHVMKSWLVSYTDGEIINGIADGNAEITKYFELQEDKSKNYMGLRSSRFVMLVFNNIVQKCFVDMPGEYKVSSPNNIIKYIDEQN